MTQPDNVPLLGPDRVRPSDRLSLPRPWRQDRPAELTDLTVPSGDCFGIAGPDVGYGLKLAKRFADRLALTAGETAADAVAGCFACGARRAATFGRAPVIYDMDWAYTLWGYLGGAPDALVHWRVELFRGAAHHYTDQRRIADSVAAAAVRLSAAEARAQLGSAWADLFNR